MEVTCRAWFSSKQNICSDVHEKGGLVGAVCDVIATPSHMFDLQCCLNDGQRPACDVTNDHND